MARIEGKIEFVTLDEDSCRLHLHSDSLCYDAVLSGAPGAVVYHLIKEGDWVALHGPITFDGNNRDIDVSHIEVVVDGKMQKLAIGYSNQYTPG